MNQTSPWVKFGVIAGFVALIAGLLLILKWQRDTLNEQQKAIIEMKQIGEGIARSQSQYATKEELEKFAKELGLNLALIKKDLDKLGADVIGINNFLATTPGYNGTDLPSDGTTPGENPPAPQPCTPGGTCPDPYGYQANVQILGIKEPMSDGTQVPFGSTEFRAWKEKPWSLHVYPRTYSVSTVLGQDENGRHHVYNKFTIKSQGKTYTVPIAKAEFKEQFPERKFRFSPRLYLGVDAGAVVNPAPTAELQPNLQVALFSYGRTKVDPDWTFAGVGLGYATQANRPTVVVSPVNYNVGHELPLVNNLHVGPLVSIDTAGGIGVMAGIRVGL